MSNRVAHHPVLPLILERWSTRAFDPAAPIRRWELACLFEAARWAPSAFNVQPWRFIFALRDEPGWSEMRDLLIPFNQGWASSAGALVCICSETDVPGKNDGERQPSYSHSFDTGAAWALFSMQATSLGLSTHAMTGFDVERAKNELKLPSNVRPEAFIAVGHAGKVDALPDFLRARDVPSDRHAIETFVFEGLYGNAVAPAE